jgi:hypothetical protein
VKSEPTLACECDPCECVDCACEKPLVSVVKPAVATKTEETKPQAKPVADQFADLRTLPAKVTTDSPVTRAPLPDKPRLTPTEAATAQKLYAANHGPLLNGAKEVMQAPAKVATAVVRAPVKMVRRFVGNSCSGGSCGPVYEWVPEQQTSKTVHYPNHGGYYTLTNGVWTWHKYAQQPAYAEPRRAFFRRW